MEINIRAVSNSQTYWRKYIMLDFFLSVLMLLHFIIPPLIIFKVKPSLDISRRGFRFLVIIAICVFLSNILFNLEQKNSFYNLDFLTPTLLCTFYAAVYIGWLELIWRFINRNRMTCTKPRESLTIISSIISFGIITLSSLMGAWLIYCVIDFNFIR